MTEAEPDNIVLRYLRQIDLRLERMEGQFNDLIARVASVEDQVVALRGDFVRLEHRFDRSDERLQRIEKRLDLTEV